LEVRRLIILIVIGLTVLSCKHTSEKEIKFQQYYIQGETLYTKHCSNCHQADGTGLGRVYPPLNTSDYMDANFEEVICLMKYGKSGELVVNGVSFNQAMPGVFTLTDIEIAEIATYIYSKWGKQQREINVQQVSTILRECPDK
jgi:mono/diheme cytochrome c family protein